MITRCKDVDPRFFSNRTGIPVKPKKVVQVVEQAKPEPVDETNLTLAGFRKVYMMFQKRDRKCGCPNGEGCGKCKVCLPASLEATVDSVRARYNLKSEMVAVHSPDKVLRYKTGRETGETKKGEIWRGSVNDFMSSYSKGFVGLCAQGWAMASESKKDN